MENKINKTYDVAICGGGFAGIAAALAAARAGKKVVLFEKQFILGGLGTAGLITIYLPLCDGYGHQVSYGISEELLKLSIKHGAEDRYPDNWLDGKGSRTDKDKRYSVAYNAQVCAILTEQLLLNEGVDILYGSYVVGVETEGEKIKYLFVENKSGRTTYHVKSVVDATGDCDIAYFANVPTEVFRQGNVLAAWYYFANQNGYQLKQLGCADIPNEEKYALKQVRLLPDRRFSGLDGEELSEFVFLSHATILNNWLQKKKEDERIVMATIPTIPQVRMTRKIVGAYTLSQNDEYTYVEDSVGMVANWRKRGPIYEVPFSSLYNKEMKNLVVAGRCTSVTEQMWDVMRVIPCCAVTGQAAGTAAAMTDNFPGLNVEILQSELIKNGVILHKKDIIS